MADNVSTVELAAKTFVPAADEVAYSSDTAKVQLARTVKVTGVEGSKTVGSATQHLVAAATTNATLIKSSPGALHSLVGFCKAVYPVYVKFHNDSNTPSAGAGVVRTFALQAGVPFAIAFPDGGIPFSTGIGMTIVKDIEDGGSTAVALSDCVVDVEYT